MINIREAMHQRREAAVTRRALNRAIDHTSSPGVRNELLTIAQRHGVNLR